MLSRHALPAVISILVNLGLGVFVYTRARQNPINRMFFAFCVVVAGWNVNTLGLTIAPSARFAWYWAKVCGLWVMLLPPVLLHFVLTFAEAIDGTRRRILYGAYAVAGVFVILNWAGQFTGAFFKAGDQYLPESTLAYRLYGLNFLLVVGYALVRMHRNLRAAPSVRRRNQIRYFFLAFLLGVAVGASIFLPSFGIRIYPIWNFGAIVLNGITAYAIVRLELMDIRIVIRRSFVYASLTGAIAGGYFAILWAFSLLSAHVAGHNVLATICFALIVVMGFQPLREKVQAVADRLFFKDRYDYHRTLRDLSGALTSVVELDRLCDLIVSTVTGTLHVDRSSFLLRDESTGEFVSAAARGLPDAPRMLSPSSALVRLLKKRRRSVNREELEPELAGLEQCRELREAKEEMESLGAVLSIPLIRKGQLIGAFNLDGKKSEDPYSAEDIGLLTTIANQAAVAVENARLYEERRGMERQLHHTDKLAALGTLASEVAHEMKNPLVSVKTFIQLFPRKYADERFRERFARIIPQELERLEDVVGELLNFARPSGAVFEPIDLEEILRELLILLGHEMSQHRVTLEMEFPRGLPKAHGNKEQLKQVFMNLTLNASHAMPGGGRLTISATISSALADTVEVRFTDTGTGIPPEDLEKLFTPFFTTKSGGTGLGLAISHRIVKAHSGTIQAESTVGKGTTFTVTLPRTPSGKAA